jgi:cytochrome b involved in lipid metabolism
MFIPSLLCALLLGIIIILELINMFNHFWKKTNKLKDFFQDEDIKLSATLPTFNLIQLHDEKSKKKWVLYDNYICDVGSYITSHPGGANMIQENLYSDSRGS